MNFEFTPHLLFSFVFRIIFIKNITKAAEGTVQKVETHCPNCRMDFPTLQEVEPGHYRCWWCNQEPPTWPIPSLEEDKKKWREEQKFLSGPTWSPPSGYFSISGCTEILSCCVRTVWYKMQKLDMNPLHNKGRVIVPRQQLDILQEDSHQIAVVHIGGGDIIIIKRASQAAKDATAEGTHITKQYVNKLIAQGIVSGFVSGQIKTLVENGHISRPLPEGTWVVEEALKEYLRNSRKR
jgi:hypothetical protein